MTRSWEDLPTEVLHLIIRFLPRATISVFARVCKKWKAVSNYNLYSKVIIFYISMLLKFNRTIVENVEIASMVKSVELDDCIDEKDSKHIACVDTLLASLPNLQNFSSGESPCFVPVKNALLGSKLLNLQTVGYISVLPFTNDYIDCILLMKNQLREVSLVGKDALYYRLLNKLDQFEKIEKVYIEISSSIFVERSSTITVEELDSIVEKCSSLREIMVSIEQHLEDNVPISMIAEQSMTSLYTPRPAVHSLEFRREDDVEVHQSFLRYLIRKYPNLKRLEFFVNKLRVNDLSTFQHFIAYVSKIKTISVGRIHGDVQWVFDGVRSYWSAKSSRQLRPSLTLLFDHDLLETDAVLCILQNKRIRIELPFSGYNLRNMDLFVRHGEHLRNLDIIGITKKQFSKRSSEEVINLMQDLIANFVHCRNVSHLSFHCCDINFLHNEGIGFKNTCLQELYFSYCSIGFRMFESLFAGMNLISALLIKNCSYLDEDNKITPFININLPNTTIGSLVYTTCSDSYDLQCVFIIISTIADGGSGYAKKYLKYDNKTHYDGYLKASNESEYNDREHSRFPHLHICCQSITSLELNHDTCKSLLPPTY